MTRYELDVEELRARLNSRRLTREMSWNALAIAVGVDKNVMQRIRSGKKPAADALLSLIAYLDIHPGLIMRRTNETPD